MSASFLELDPGWSWLVLLHTTLGTGLIASGTAALNQWWERDADARMPRTQKRPLPSHRMSSAKRMWFGIALSVLGFVELWLGANLLTAILGAVYAGELSVHLYAAEAADAALDDSRSDPGAMPPVIGYAAAHGILTLEAAGAVRDSVSVAVPALLFDRLAVSRRLFESRHQDASSRG